MEALDGRVHGGRAGTATSGRRRSAALGRGSPRACALLAFFTKAAAAFFVAALGLDALLSLR